MASITSSPLLALPQELRDLIYEQALSDTLPWSRALLEHGTNTLRKSIILDPVKDDTEALIFNYPAQCPRPTWYTLLLCCKTTNKDIQELAQTTALKQKSNNPPAVIYLRLSSTTATAMWQSIPCHPRHISELHVNIRLSDIYESCFTSGAPNVDNAIIRALFHLLRQYCQFGPHLSRKTPLSASLSLLRLVLNIETDYNSDQQLATISGVLLIWLYRFARSGLLFKRVGELIWDCRHVVEIQGDRSFKVTDDIWDHEDRETFLELGGYSWN